MVENIVNRVLMVKEGELVLTEFTQLPKDFLKFTVSTESLLVNIGNHLKTSVYEDRSAN